METRSALLALLIALYSSSSFAQVGRSELAAGNAELDSIDRADLSAFMDGFIDSRMEDYDTVGATVSIVHQGDIIFSKGYGFDDKKRGRLVDPDRSLFRPGSISKTLTWTAVMQLYEQGRLDLGANIQDYLPELKLDLAFDKPITMLDLMAHQPGFEDSFLGHLFEASSEDRISLREYLQTHQPVQVYSPGTISAYSNYGVGLAGLIVANISGLSFEEYIEQFVTGPLGMSNTTFREPLSGRPDMKGMPEHLVNNVSKAYQAIGGGHTEFDFAYIGNLGPAGSVSTTANDMAIWMLTHLGNGAYHDARILKESTAIQMHSQHQTNHPKFPGMAHGFIESDINGYRSYGHDGGTVRFVSILRIIPELELGLFVSTNTGSQYGFSLKGLPRKLVERYFPRNPAASIVGNDQRVTGELQTYFGQYVFSRRSSTKLEKLASTILAVGPAENNGVTVNLGTQTDTYRVVEKDLLVAVDNPDNKLAFFRDESDHVAGFHMSDSPVVVAERANLWNNVANYFNAVAFCALVFLGVLTNMWHRRNQRIEQSAAERNAAITSYTLSALWIFGLLALGVSLMRMTSDTSMAFFGFPSATVMVGLTVILGAALFSVVNVLLLAPVWTTKSWPLWRRIRHTVVAFLAVALVWYSYVMNVLGYQYF
ncbi:MAG: serine hydrolase domain-containing protein [Pseudomonadota bacterium]